MNGKSRVPTHTVSHQPHSGIRAIQAGVFVDATFAPNVGGGDMRSQNLLRSYLESLAKTRDLARDEELEVLPGHGEPMQAAADRCEQLMAHHRQRLDQLMAILRRYGEQTVFEIAVRLFGEMKSFHVVLGCAEANAHLEWLIQEGKVISEGGTFAVAESS